MRHGWVLSSGPMRAARRTSSGPACEFTCARAAAADEELS